MLFVAQFGRCFVQRFRRRGATLTKSDDLADMSAIRVSENNCPASTKTLRCGRRFKSRRASCSFDPVRYT
jgi:hypothetical protein